jgi:hypothetical protein
MTARSEARAWLERHERAKLLWPECEVVRALLAEADALAAERDEAMNICGDALGTDPSLRTAVGCAKALAGWAAGTEREELRAALSASRQRAEELERALRELELIRVAHTTTHDGVTECPPDARCDYCAYLDGRSAMENTDGK